MDRITQAILAGDRDVLRQQYADDAVGEAPDAGRIEGGDAIVEYLLSFRQAFPDLSWEAEATFESTDSALDEGRLGGTPTGGRAPGLWWAAEAPFESTDGALDEGRLVGTHTGTLSSPEGDVPPTGKHLRLRE